MTFVCTPILSPPASNNNRNPHLQLPKCDKWKSTAKKKSNQSVLRQFSSPMWLAFFYLGFRKLYIMTAKLVKIGQTWLAPVTQGPHTNNSSKSVLEKRYRCLSKVSSFFPSAVTKRITKQTLGSGQRFNKDNGMVITREFISPFDSVSISVGWCQRTKKNNNYVSADTSIFLCAFYIRWVDFKLEAKCLAVEGVVCFSNFAALKGINCSSNKKKELTWLDSFTSETL